MGVCYELQSSSDSTEKRVASSLVEVDGENLCAEGSSAVLCINEAEFADYPLAQEVKENIETMMSAASNYVDVFPDYIIGSFAVPSKNSDAKSSDLFAFYMDTTRLVFIDNKDTASKILQGLQQNSVMRNTTPAHCLYLFCKHILFSDLEYLAWMEDQMESMEESLVTEEGDIDAKKVMEYRKSSMKFSTYYEQMATVVSDISDNENGMMSLEDAHSFDHIESIADRLASRAQTLKEYSLQLYELQQTSIDLKQNSIMQVFTIVTVFFAPLTLITGWFGMNLSVIPGLEVPWMWMLLVILAIVFTVIFLLFFKKKNWL